MSNENVDKVNFSGSGQWVILNEDGSTDSSGEFKNIITEVGDEYYAERATGISSPPAQLTGVKLGTGTTSPATKTGAASQLVTYLANSHQAFDAGFPSSSLSGGARRITFQVTFAPGKATSASTPIAEAVLVNETLTDATSLSAATIARALFSPSFTKSAAQSLILTWNHDLAGS